MGLSQKPFGDLFDVSQQTVSDLEDGKKAYCRTWKKLASILDMSEDSIADLMDEAAEQIKKTQRRPRDLPPRRSRSARSLFRPIEHSGPDIDVLGQAVGGADGEYVFNGDVIERLARPAEMAGITGAYAVRVAGESMSPAFTSGEAVFVDPSERPHRNDIVIIQLRPREEGMPPRGFIKRFVGWTPGYLSVMQFNPQKEIRYPREDVESVHVVVHPTI